MATAAELKQILKEDKYGKNLYDHLTETLMKILVDRPANAFESFELISAAVKENPLNPDPTIGRPLPPSAAEITKQTEWTQKCSTLLTVPAEDPEDNGVKYPDLTDEANLLEWANVSIGKGDLYRLYLSIKKLAESLPGEVERLRFFGKITTRTSAYWVVEGINPEEPEIADPRKMEGKSGPNKYAYWVAKSVNVADVKEWVKLPNVTQEQIVKARLFKRLLTGDLDAAVPSYPPFPGTERNLLRTQIARIAGATLVSPDGFFKLDEDEVPNIKLAEGEDFPEPKSSGDLKEPTAWKHHEPDLNVLGRVRKLPEPEEGTEPTPDDEVEASGLLDDIKPEDWGIRLAPGGSGKANASAVYLRSIQWPGAVAIAAGRRFLNVYIGNAAQYSAKAYSPPFPAEIQSEYALVPKEGDEEGFKLIEDADTTKDPTPPKPADAEEE